MSIREGYKNIPLPEKLRSYLVLMRPYTLIAPAAAGFFGTLAPVNTIGVEEIKTAIYVAVTLVILQAAGQVINQYADAELDKIVKPYRPIPRGLISRDEAVGLGFFLTIVGVARGFMVSMWVGAMASLLAFLSIFYSLPPFSPRRLDALLNLLWVSLGRGFIPAILVYGVYGDPSEALIWGVVALLWCISLQHAKDVEDAEGDKAHGIKTIPNTYGIKGAKILASTTSTTLYIIATITNHTLLLTLIPISIISIALYDKKSKYTENTYGWTGFYIGLGIIYIIMFLEPRI